MQAESQSMDVRTTVSLTFVYFKESSREEKACGLYFDQSEFSQFLQITWFSPEVF